MTGMASPRDYNMYNVAEAQFWKQRVARETAVLSQSQDLSKLIGTTREDLMCVCVHADHHSLQVARVPRLLAATLQRPYTAVAAHCIEIWLFTCAPQPRDESVIRRLPLPPPSACPRHSTATAPLATHNLQKAGRSRAETEAV